MPLEKNLFTTIHQAFEITVKATPNATALIDDHTFITYAELNQQANQLAHYIHQKYEKMYSHAMPPNTLVGICLERGVSLIISILAVLKASAAYVPLDPGYPEKRLRFIAKDCKMSLCIHHSSADSLDLTPCNIYLKEENDDIKNQSMHPITSTVTPSDLAYVIYTSGTTGNPKGVMVAHAGVCNMIYCGINLFPITEKDRILQVTSAMFDVSVWEIGSALFSGAALVLTAPIYCKDPNYLIKTIIKNAVTVISTVPSLLKSLIAQEDFKKTTSLKHVMSCAEPLTSDICHQLFQTHDVNLYNGYGPTEASIICTLMRYTKKNMPTTISIGSAINGIQLLILDINQKVTPQGEIGELYIGGIGVAIGYINRKQLTQEKFVLLPAPSSSAHPFKYDRHYRTGDLVRRLDDGHLEFISRMDDQVKLRGFRIELREIETHLRFYPDIADCVVSIKTLNEQSYLVAYCIIKQNKNFCIKTLRSYLKKILPDYMIPTFFLKINEIPLNENGKIDKQSLPIPDIRSRY